MLESEIQSAGELPLNWKQRASITLAKRPWIVFVTCFSLAALVTLPLFIVGFPKGGDAVKQTIKVLSLAVIAAFTLTVSVLAIASAPLKPETLERRLARREAPEYRPVWWDSERHEDLEQASVVIDSGDAVVQKIDDRGISQSYHVSANSESVLRMRPLYFPGWVARADGRPVEIRPSSGGNIELRMEPGEHQLTLSFEDTWPRTTGKLISAVCIAGLVVLLFVARRSDHQPDNSVDYRVVVQ